MAKIRTYVATNDTLPKVKSLECLKNGGEMGRLMRSFDWSNSQVGPVEKWPQSLQTAVSIILNSSFPMFIWWGKDTLINFYNDAYMEILGDKHPNALGKSGEVAWREIWQEIGPLGEKVFTTGKPVFKKDMPLLLNRNGQMEQTYFTFSYSPVRDEAGNIGGMFCVCNETTSEKVTKLKQEKAEQNLQANRDRLQEMFNESPAAVAVIKGKKHIYEQANKFYQRMFNLTEKQLIGKSVREVFPEIHGQGIYEIVEAVYTSGKAFRADEFPAAFDRKRNGIIKTGYFNVVMQPLFVDKKVDSILIHAVEVTDIVNARNQVQKSEERYRTLFNSIDEGFAVIEMIYDKQGKPYDYKFIEVNKSFGKQSGLKNAQGKRMREIAPDHDEHWYEIYGGVAKTGKSVRFHNETRVLKRYFDVFATRLGGEGSNKVAIIFKDITKRRQIDDALKENKEKFRKLVETTNVIPWTADGRTGIFTYVGPQAEAMFGYTIQEWYKKDFWAKLIHVEDRKEAVTYCQEAMRTKKDYEFEYRMITKNGDVVWVRDIVTVSKGSDGSSVLSGFLLDITKQKLIELELRESETRFKNLADTSPMYIAMADENGNAVYFNKPWLEFTGKQLPEMIGMGWLSTLHPEDAPKFKRDFKRAFKKQATITEQYRFIRADGEFRWMLAVGAPRFTPDGRFIGYFGTYTDFHDLKKAQLALEESDKRFRALVTASTDVMYRLNPDWSKMWLLDGHDIHTESGDTDDDWLKKYTHPEHRTQVESIIRDVIAKKAPLELEHKFVYPDGETGWAYTSAIPLLDDRGNIIEWFGTSSDITEEKRAMEKQQKLAVITEQRNALMKVNKAKDEFIALASHQLRTPATAVKQYIGLILNEFAGPITTEQEEFLQTAHDSNERQLQIINELLKTAQLDSSNYALTKKLYNIVQLGREVIEELQPALEFQNQTLMLETDSDEIFVSMDVMEIKLVLMNLLENASKYSYAGTKIRLVFRKKDKFVLLSVIDKGVGVGQENKDRIFEKFTRVNNELSDVVEGTGLGLYWVKQIVDLHKGSITLNSNIGNGSEFRIMLPYE